LKTSRKALIWSISIGEALQRNYKKKKYAVICIVKIGGSIPEWHDYEIEPDT